MIRLISALLLLFIYIGAKGQNDFPFKIKLEPVILKDFPGLQSYAWAKADNLILFAGGRLDGLHKRQPFAAFNKQNNNTELIVLDLNNLRIWKKNIASLPATLGEQLQSSNMQFYQDGNHLILTGGYGYSDTKRNHITHASLISIKVKELINAIINNESIEPYVQQLSDERMAVTGGRLNKLNKTFYLIGGQHFTGRYNPHGPDHGPGFSQQYTNQIRKFNLTTIGNKICIENYTTITDSQKLHRRDYNLLPQIDDEGNETLTLFSGVFQYDKDIPFTTLIDISENNYKEVDAFNQQFSHYHTATLPVYSKKAKTMFSIFFGGIAQHYNDNSGKKITDNNIPFVKTISVIERNGDAIKEYILDDEMPGYFGAASEFIPSANKLFIENGILDLDKISGNPQLIGYIIGGIDSRAPNVFWSNDADASRASPVIWEVYIRN